MPLSIRGKNAPAIYLQLLNDAIREEQNEDVPRERDVEFICVVRCGAVWSRFSQAQDASTNRSDYFAQCQKG